MGYLHESYGFDAEGPSLDYAGNENNYKHSEHDNQKQKSHHGPQFHQNQPSSGGVNSAETKKGLNACQDAKRSAGENVNGGVTEHLPDKKCDLSALHTHAHVNTSAIKGIIEGQTTLPGFGRDFLITRGISQENLLDIVPDKEIYTNRTCASEEPESLQDEICQSVEGNSSLTESAILDIRNDTVSQRHTPYLNDCYESDSLKSDNMVVTNGETKSNGGRWGSLDFTDSIVDYVATSQPLHFATHFGGQAALCPRSEEMDDEDIDPDVAEALAALAAATAGEDYEDDVNWENGY
ncbi:uncharacterized protein [Ambystoma mexicanum]|uniref:uncharacterized protein isoform X2 n=1 Tax=Ambystoma mexicanum TaxID=8296 RepID=UPI0037E785FC